MWRVTLTFESPQSYSSVNIFYRLYVSATSELDAREKASTYISVTQEKFRLFIEKCVHECVHECVHDFTYKKFIQICWGRKDQASDEEVQKFQADPVSYFLENSISCISVNFEEITSGLIEIEQYGHEE